VETRLARLRDLYELGHVTRDDYLARHAELETERNTLATSKPRPLFFRQQDMLRTLVDDWAHLTIEDRRRLVSEVFAEVRVDAQGVRDFMPRDEWKPYMAAVIPATARVTTERKTGVKHAEVVTVRLLQDERGWLRLAWTAASSTRTSVRPRPTSMTGS
jgi:hypothetical protein